eukprot:1718424-Rhodomonas_salina.1
MLSQYHASHSTIRYLSTGDPIPPYAIAVNYIAACNHTLSQYCVSRTTIRCLSTAHCIPPYAFAVPLIA